MEFKVFPCLMVYRASRRRESLNIRGDRTGVSLHAFIDRSDLRELS